MTDHLTQRHAGFTAPSSWIERWAGLVPPGAPVLDLACGNGRHGRLFLGRGHETVFLDKDTTAVADLAGTAGADIREVDLEGGRPFPLAGRRFGAVIVTCYLHRPILHDIVAAVAPGGVLLYETFAKGNEAYGHPAREAYLLEEGELLRAVDGKLTVRAYEHGYDDVPKPGIRQRICAVHPAG
ncbi:MAG: class I SAM-dependent methyltransferase [Alphaproteobacteria bacterium]|nr:class I SAM-dependent methyltransferase [Alphaproteobacteria bacterium]